MNISLKKQKIRDFLSSDDFLGWISAKCPLLIKDPCRLSRMLSGLEKRIAEDPDHDHTVITKIEGLEIALGVNMMNFTPWLSISSPWIYISSDCPVSIPIGTSPGNQP